MSEHLTAQNAHIATIARRLRKSERIDSTWVRNGIVFIRELISKDKNKDKTIHVIKKLSFLNDLGINYSNLQNDH